MTTVYPNNTKYYRIEYDSEGKQTWVEIPSHMYWGGDSLSSIKIGDKVLKHSGDYQIEGIVRSVFTTGLGKIRYVVEHKAEGGGSFLHIYSDANIRKITT